MAAVAALGGDVSPVWGIDTHRFGTRMAWFDTSTNLGLENCYPADMRRKTVAKNNEGILKLVDRLYSEVDDSCALCGTRDGKR